MARLETLIDTALTLATGLVPGAFGSAVGLAWEKGLTWTDRFIQFSVGVVVSFFAGRVVSVVWPWQPMDPFVLQGVTFTLGMIAFRATPRIATNLTDVLAELPGALRFFIPKRKDGQ